MTKMISDIALAKVPSFANRVSLYPSKSQTSGHTSGIITEQSHALYKEMDHIDKLPEEFTQQDIDGS